MFSLIVWLSFEVGRGGEVVWNWTSKVKGVVEFWTKMDKGVGVLKTGQFS